VLEGSSEWVFLNFPLVLGICYVLVAYSVLPNSTAYVVYPEQVLRTRYLGAERLSEESTHAPASSGVYLAPIGH
jgi:hypothetical protein